MFKKFKIGTKRYRRFKEDLKHIDAVRKLDSMIEIDVNKFTNAMKDEMERQIQKYSAGEGNYRNLDEDYINSSIYDVLMNNTNIKHVKAEGIISPSYKLSDALFNTYQNIKNMFALGGNMDRLMELTDGNINIAQFILGKYLSTVNDLSMRFTDADFSLEEYKLEMEYGDLI